MPGPDGSLSPLPAAPAPKPKNTQPFLKPIGNRLPSPLYALWSPDLKYLALIYKDKTALYGILSPIDALGCYRSPTFTCCIPSPSLWSPSTGTTTPSS